MNLRNVAQDVVRLAAKSIVLSSGQPAMLELPAGNKFSKQVTSHSELTQILLEAAPRAFHSDIQAGRSPGQFGLMVDGVQFSVRVAENAGVWRIAVSLASNDLLPSHEPKSGGRTSGADVPRSEPSEPLNSQAPPWPGPSGSAHAASGAVSPDFPGRSAPNFHSQSSASAPPSPANSTHVPSATTPWTSNAGSSYSPNGSSPPSSASTPTFSTNQNYGPGTGSPGASAPPALSDASISQAPRSATQTGFSSTPSSRLALSEQPAAPPRVEATSDAEPEINAILRRLVKDKGSDVHLTSGLVPMYRVSGNIQPISGFPVVPEEKMREMLFAIMPARVRKEFLETNDADFAHAIEGLSRFRVNVAMDRHGTLSVIRVIPFQILSAEQIGLPKKVLDLCWLTKGLVLVTGPTGSGKSTTLATMIDFINSHRQDHIITIEDPIEFVHPDNRKCLIHQREVGEHTTSFKRALKAALREDPDIVLVGEMRDLETIAIAIETAETGHLVFGTLHTSTAPSTVDRIIDQFPANQQAQVRTMLSESMKGVIAQTLCKKVGGGRCAAYEVLIGTKAVANLIRESKTFQLMSIIQTNKEAGMISMNESLINLVRQRLVSAEEAFMKSVDKEEFRKLLENSGIKLKMKNLLDE